MRIACLIAADFEDSEYSAPAEAFRTAGHEVAPIGMEAGLELQGKRHRATLTTEMGIDQARVEDFDALFLPGGYSPDQLRADPRFVEFCHQFMTQNRPVLAICHGPQLLLTAGDVGGRRMTAWKTVQGDLRWAGAEVVDEAAVRDGNLVTSRQPDDIPDFISQSLELLGSLAGVVPGRS